MNADKMISNTRIGYLNYYISKTFPNYCKFITKNGFNKLINVIKENEFIKTCNFDKMKNGEYNEVIDNLVYVYVEKYIIDNIANYSEFYNYVKILIGQQNLELGEEFFEELARKLSLNIISEGNDISDSRLYGKYARELLNLYDDEINKYKKLIYDRIADTLSKHTNIPKDIRDDMIMLILNECNVHEIVYGLNDNEILSKYDRLFDIEINKLSSKIRQYYFRIGKDVIERVVLTNDFGYHNNTLQYFIYEILSQYNMYQMVDGLDKKDVLNKFREIQINVIKQIENKVKNIHADLVPAPINLKLEEIINYVKSMSLTNGKFKIDSLFKGKYDDEIRTYCYNKEGNNRQTKEDAVSNYISNLIYSRVKHRLGELNNEDIEKIYMSIIVHMSKYNVLPFDVLHHKYDDFISNTCDAYLRKINSTVRKNMPKKIKYNRKKRRMSRLFVALAIAGTIVSSGVIMVDKTLEVIDAVALDTRYNIAVTQFENRGVSDTEIISTIHSDSFQDAAINVINFYKMCKEKGIDDSKYLALGFNLVRNQISSNRTLAVMDELLDRVKDESKKIDGANDLREIVDDSCFLEFAYEELYKMGCKEITNDKYLSLIRAYVVADSKAKSYMDETPWDYLSDENKELAIELMNLYKRYSSKAVVELNGLIASEEETKGIVTFLSSMNSVGSGKNRG